MKQFFPVVLIVLDLAAAGVYLSHGDWRKGVYWFAAAVLTSTVTFQANVAIEIKQKQETNNYEKKRFYTR